MQVSSWTKCGIPFNPRMCTPLGRGTSSLLLRKKDFLTPLLLESILPIWLVVMKLRDNLVSEFLIFWIRVMKGILIKMYLLLRIKSICWWVVVLFLDYSLLSIGRRRFMLMEEWWRTLMSLEEFIIVWIKVISRIRLLLIVFYVMERNIILVVEMSIILSLM